MSCFINSCAVVNRDRESNSNEHTPLISKAHQESGYSSLESNHIAQKKMRRFHFDRHGHERFSNQNSGSNDDELQNGPFIDFNSRMAQLNEAQREEGERLRRHLQFFFLSPINKFKIRKQIPYKLVLQILKVFFVTVQLVLFAQLRISHVDFLGDTVTVMRHKFLKEWSDERDAIVYPPNSGRYSVFSSDEIIEHFSHIVKSYYSIQNESFASFSYDTSTPHFYPANNDSYGLDLEIDFKNIPPIELCIERIADVDVLNNTYIFDISPVKECFRLNFSKEEVIKIKSDPFAIRDLFIARNITFKPEDALIISKAIVNFNLRTIHFSPVSTDQKPECYKINIQITFDNSRHSGQVFVGLVSTINYVNICNGRVLKVGSLSMDTILISIMDIFVLLLCVSSLVLCCRALFNAYLLQKRTKIYFEEVLQQKFTIQEQWEFINMWYVTIIVNDAFIILGTLCKVTIEFRDFDNDLFTFTGIFLGLGALLVYIGLFRYLGFFNQYNVLMLTLKKALPNLLRFMVCTIILYVAFLLAGWVIIGPYSMKFRTLSQSSEALFSLLNGDDMFATFYTIDDSNTTIKIFGKVYIYIFVALFIYMVLSVFIAIIMDAFEVVKAVCHETIEVETSVVKEFMASADYPDNFEAPEVRAQFSADNLLRLGKRLSLSNWRARLNHWRNSLQRRPNFPAIHNFGNPVHEDSSTSHQATYESSNASISLNTLSSV